MENSTLITYKSINNTQVCQTICIQNLHGLHTRPSVNIATMAKQFRAKIWFECGLQQADAKSVLQIMTLEAYQGTALTVCAAGQDAELAVIAIISLLQHYEDRD